jgi:proline iminopeptidase
MKVEPPDREVVVAAQPPRQLGRVGELEDLPPVRILGKGERLVTLLDDLVVELLFRSCRSEVASRVATCFAAAGSLTATVVDMSEAESLFGDEHVRRYRETGGEVGHIWKRGAKILLLTTKGRRTGEPRTAPLIYEDVDGVPVIVASKGGAPEHPGWYRNLLEDPEVTVQILDDVFVARARTATGEERDRLWTIAARQWPDYDVYETRTAREIPVVVLERR